MTPAMAPATKTGLEVAATLSTSLGTLPAPVIARRSLSSVVVDALDRSGRWPAVTGLDEGKVSLRRSAVRRSGIFRSGLLSAQLSVERQAVFFKCFGDH